MRSEIDARRLHASDRLLAKRLFILMAQVFGERAEELSDSYVDALLANEGFWALAAFVEEELVGGITAYTIPLTREQTSTLFVYDVAVRADHQRRGVGRELMRALEVEAVRHAIDEVFVLVDDADADALDFYRALGGLPAAVTMFDFRPRR